MQLNDTNIRGVLTISCAEPQIRSQVQGVLKQLTIKSTCVDFSNDITAHGKANVNQLEVTNDAIIHKTANVNRVKVSNEATAKEFIASEDIKTPKILLSGSYGTGDPPADAAEGQIYFKII